MLKKFTLCAVVVLAAGYSESSFGFWSKLKHSIHQRITTAALGNEFLPSLDPDGPKWKFTSEAIERIKEHNAATDHPDVYVDYLHFDNESYDRSYANLKDLRLSLIVGLLAENPSQDDAWYRLGRMLHAVQDYYSHSTWAEDPGRQYIRFGAGTIYDAPRPEDLPTEQSLGGACVDTEGSTEGSIRDFDQPHTTGYYLAGPPQQELQSGDCRHGNLEYHIGRSVAECGLPDQGINQDYDCQPYFPRAIRGAYDSSVELVSSIVIQLAETGNLRGVCILMGIDLSNPECLGEVNPVQVAMVIPSTSSDTFGNSLAFERDTIIVANDREDANDVVVSGAVYVFVRNSNGDWDEVQKLIPSDPLESDEFGDLIALDDDLLAIRANSGIYVFERSGSVGASWVETAKIIPSMVQGVDGFFWDLAVQDDVILSGGFVDGHSRVFLFRQSGAAWNLEASLSASDQVRCDSFGKSIVPDGSAILVGTDGNSCREGPNQRGAVYQFSMAGNQIQKLQPPDLTDTSLFGFVSAIDGDTAIISAPSFGANREGAVYVHRKTSGSSWNQFNRILADPDSVNGGNLGAVAAIDDGLMVLGQRGGVLHLLPFESGWEDRVPVPLGNDIMHFRATGYRERVGLEGNTLAVVGRLRQTGGVEYGLFVFRIR